MNLASIPGYEYRDRQSFAFSKEISKPFGTIDRVISWCKSEMLGEWRWEVVEMSSDVRPGRYCFFFDSERDYVAFLLQWQ
jgi:hypothetical protein